MYNSKFAMLKTSNNILSLKLKLVVSIQTFMYKDSIH